MFDPVRRLLLVALVALGQVLGGAVGLAPALRSPVGDGSCACPSVAQHAARCCCAGHGALDPAAEVAVERGCCGADRAAPDDSDDPEDPDGTDRPGPTADPGRAEHGGCRCSSKGWPGPPAAPASPRDELRGPSLAGPPPVERSVRPPAPRPRAVVQGAAAEPPGPRSRWALPVFSRVFRL